MAGIHDYWEFCDDFMGAGLLSASATAFDPWVITDDSSAGTPLYTRLDHGETAGTFRPGVARLVFDSQVEAQNVCLSFGDVLSFDINKVKGFECGARFVAGAGAAKDTTTTVAWGLTGDRNNAIDSIAIASIFRLAATDASHAVVIENDDATNTNDDVATGFTMTDAAWCKFTIDFSNLEDVKYYAGLATTGLNRVGGATTMKMSSYAAGLQPFFQIQKTSDSNVDRFEIDYVRVWGVR
jgi:hypothetical protein